MHRYLGLAYLFGRYSATHHRPYSFKAQSNIFGECSLIPQPNGALPSPAHLHLLVLVLHCLTDVLIWRKGPREMGCAGRRKHQFGPKILLYACIASHRLELMHSFLAQPETLHGGLA